MRAADEGVGATLQHPAQLVPGTNQLPPIPVLNAESVRQVMDENESGGVNGESSEYVLAVHNRQVAKVDVRAWDALPSTKSKGKQQGVPKLRSLDLSFNSISEFDLRVLEPLKELRELKVYANRLTTEGLDDGGLGRLTKLERLELHANHLTEPPMGLTALTKLRVLRLERNKITRVTNMSKCTALAELTLDGNELTVLNGLNACQSLMLLSASDNDIEKVPGNALKTCGKLRELVLSRNALQANALASFAPCAGSLEILRLQGNRLESLTPIPALAKLTELHVASNRLSDGALATLRACTPLLEVLDVSDNRMEDLASISDALKDVPELRELAVMGNPCCPDDTGARTVTGWWATLREALPQIHLLDEGTTGRFDAGDEAGASASPRPVTPAAAASASNRARPASSAGRPGSARPGSAEGGRPLMRPPSTRTAYGTDFKLEPLEDMHCRADNFRRAIDTVKGELKAVLNGKEINPSKIEFPRQAPSPTPSPSEPKAPKPPPSLGLEHKTGDGSEGKESKDAESPLPSPPSSRRSKLTQALGFSKCYAAPGQGAEAKANSGASSPSADQKADFFVTTKASPVGHLVADEEEELDDQAQPQTSLPSSPSHSPLERRVIDNKATDQSPSTSPSKFKDLKGREGALVFSPGPTPEPGSRSASPLVSTTSPLGGLGLDAKEEAPKPRISKPWQTAPYVLPSTEPLLGSTS